MIYYGAAIRMLTVARRTNMCVKTILSVLAFAALIVVTAASERAQASSLSSPGAASVVQDSSGNPATEVRWHSHYGWHRHFGWRRHYGWGRRHWRFR